MILAAGMVTAIFFEFDSFLGFAPFGTMAPYGYNGPFTNVPFYTVYVIAIVIVGLLDLYSRTGGDNPQLEMRNR